MKKILSLTLALVMLLSGFHTVFAGWDGFVGEDEAYTVLDTSNVLKIINSGAAPVDNGPDMENNTSIYWAHTGSSPQIRILSAGSYDFSEYKKLRMQMFSAEKTNSKIAFVCGKASGGYYFYSLDINWVGWKEIKIPLEKFSMNGSGVSGWHDITYIDIYAHGWNMTPNPKTVLYINTVYLEKEESNSSIAVDEKLLKKLLDESVCFYADRNQYLDKNQVKYYQSTPSYESDGICYVASDELEACLGKAVTVDKETMKVSIDGKITDIIGIESDGTMYASVADVAKAMGKNTVVYKNLVVVSDNKAVNDVKRNTKMLDEMAKSTTQNSVDPTTITEEDMKFTLQKWENYLTGGGASEHSKAKNAKAAETARGYQNSMNKTDDAVILWGNAPCESTAQMRTQYTNLRNMAIAWATPGTEAYHDEQLKEDILFGIEWGYENLFGEDEIKNEGWRDTGIYNWYEWQIGVPHDLSIICMLLRDEIPSAEMKKYLKPVDYFTNERFGSLINTNNRGANIADTASPFIISQLLQNNADMVNKAVNIIVRDLDYSYKEAEDGQHTDGSYRFHYYYAMNGTYGLAFMSAVVPIINIMNDTKFEIIDCNIDRYAEWMFKAYETSVYNGRMMSVFRGRSPGGEASTGTSAISNMLEFSEVLNKSDRTRMQSMLKYFGENGYISENSLNEAPYNILKRILDDDTIKPRESFKDFNMFYNTDKAVWQNDDYAMAISMSSSRTSGWESINGENKKGWYQGDGMVYLYTNDDASTYEDSFWKNVNYYRLPGTTVDTQERAAESIQDQRVYQSSQSFVGGVELGEKYGVAAMLLESCHNETSDGYTSQYGNALPIHHNDLMVLGIVNGASDEDILKDYIGLHYKKLVLEEADVTARNGAKHLAEVLYANKQYASYSELLTMVSTAFDKRDELNACEWSRLTAFIESNADVILSKSTKLSNFKKLSSEEKAQVCQRIKKHGEFFEFSTFAKAFDDETDAQNGEAVIVVKPGSSGGGGGGGGSYRVPSAPQTDVTDTEDIVDIAVSGSGEQEAPFGDLESVSWANESIMGLYKRKVISDSEDRRFRPNDNITREEYVKLIAVAFELYDENAESDFSDVDKNEWYYKYISSLVSLGLVNGDGESTFGTGKNITRQDMMTIAYRVLEYKKLLGEAGEEEHFADDGDIASYAKKCRLLYEKYRRCKWCGR